MISPNSNFHEAIKDPSTYRQNLVVRFEDAFLSGNDGDIEQSGVEFDEYFCTDEDLVYGECPSSLMKASFINEDQVLRSVGWGFCDVYIGYLAEESDSAFSDGVNAEITKYGHTYSAKPDGFYVDGTKIVDGECYSLITTLDDDFYRVWCFGNGYSGMIRYDLYSEEVLNYIPQTSNRFMNMKMRKPRVIEWEGNDAYEEVFACTVYEDGKKYDWQYAPMGQFYVEKPSNLSGYVVEINEAKDAMYKFDVEATDFLRRFYFRFPDGADINTWTDQICSYVGVTFSRPIITDTTAFKYTPNTSVTLRTILGWLAEAYDCVFRISRDGYLSIYKVGTASVEEIGLDRIAADSFTMAEYVTKPTTMVMNKNLSGITYITGGGDNGYYILGNPFVQNAVPLDGRKFFSYPPMTLTVLEADPLVEVGDMVSVWTSDEDYKMFVDEYNRVLTDESNRILTMDVTPINVPLMHRILRWNGVCTADYEITGNPKRLVPSDAEQTDYNSNIANDTENMINKLLVGQLFARYIEATDFHLKGGGIEIETDVQTRDIIRLNYADPQSVGYIPTYVQLTPSSVVVGAEPLDDAPRIISITPTSITIKDDSTGMQTSIGMSSVIMYGTSGTPRVILNSSGLYFYDESFRLTQSYPAT